MPLAAPASLIVIVLPSMTFCVWGVGVAIENEDIAVMVFVVTTTETEFEVMLFEAESVALNSKL